MTWDKGAWDARRFGDVARAHGDRSRYYLETGYITEHVIYQARAALAQWHARRCIDSRA